MSVISPINTFFLTELEGISTPKMMPVASQTHVHVPTALRDIYRDRNNISKQSSYKKHTSHTYLMLLIMVDVKVNYEVITDRKR